VGFLNISTGNFVADPTGTVVYDPGTQRFKIVGTPVLYGDGGATSDPAFKRWLPVKPGQVSADGSSYVYTREASPNQFLNEIHLVDVASGRDRIIDNQGAYVALADRSEGVYLTHHLMGTDTSNGLWLLDPATRSLQPYQASMRASWEAIADGRAWTFSTDGGRFGSNSLAALDLASGALTTWFTAPSAVQVPQDGSKSVRAIAFDSSMHPIVEVYVFGGGTPAIWLITGPGQATQVTGLKLADFTPPPGIPDSNGAWVVGADGVYLYQGASFQRVAPAPSAWTTPNYSIAGPCGAGTMSGTP
jgi:hypothetical protein